MLTDLNRQQSNDEQVWTRRLSFDVETRDTEQGELVRRTYTYSYAEEFDEWHLYRYREQRCDESAIVGERNWTLERDVYWDESSDIDIDVPAVVSDQLSTILEQDVVLK